MDNNDETSFGYNALLLIENDNLTESDKKEAFNLLKRAVVSSTDSFLWYRLGEMYREFHDTTREGQCFYVARVLANFQNSR